jgi:catechol 2,3-dioxygenase-like lactoylglutathione lyase family enzyme
MAIRVAVDHVGITVPDLDEAIDFFVDLLGFDVVFRSADYDDFGYVWPGNETSEKATLRLAVLKLGDDYNIELLEYTNRVGVEDRPAPQPADRGGMHLALFVEEIEALAARLEARPDVQVLAPVQVEEGGQIDGLVWSYFLAPFGLVIELLRWEPGMPYESCSQHRMVQPPWRR